MRPYAAWIVLLLIGCAKGDTETECRPGQLRCLEGGAQACGDDGRWASPTACPQGTECRTGACVSLCGDGCAADEKRCAPEGGVQTCVVGDDGCGVWGEAEPCAAGTTCMGGACVAGCPVDCQGGERRCTGDRASTTCALGGDCPAWAAPEACAADLSCSGGQCVAAGACTDQCDEGDADCFDATHEQRCERLDSGCLDWAAPVACPAQGLCEPGAGCGGGGSCTDACAEGESRCAEGGRQTCARGEGGCLAWGAVEPCPAGKTCAAGECADSCVNACELGARRCTADGHAVETCVGEGGCTRWGAPLACPGETLCVGDGQCGVCMPDASEMQACGACGHQGRTCSAQGQWSDWGSCDGQGECQPGETRGCGNCGTQRCGDDCRWGACEGSGECQPGQTRGCGNCGTARCDGSCHWGGCEGQGECAPGSTGACGQCGMRSCNGACHWEACNNGDGTLWRHCNQCGWQFCCPNGDWCNCAAHFGCNGGSCVGAGVCQ
jgi:hypothetical protein